MTRMFSAKSVMPSDASANFADACSPCAHDAYKNVITLILDAIIMASIIVALISLNSAALVWNLVLLAVLLLVVLLLTGKLNTRRRQPSS